MLFQSQFSIVLVTFALNKEPMIIDKILYFSGSRMKMLSRTLIFGVILILCAWVWTYNEVTYSLIMLFCLYQILLFKYTTIIVYEDRITYSLSNLLKVNSTTTTLIFDAISEVSFPQPVVNRSSQTSFLFTLFFQGEKNTITVKYLDASEKDYTWKGNQLEIKAACEKVNEQLAVK